MLPRRAWQQVSQPLLDGRYANEALLLINGAIIRHGGQMRDYQVKIFGGASMFKAPNRGDPVSDRNITAAWQLVDDYHVKVSAHDLGGTVYRQLIFDISSGDVFMKKGVAASAAMGERVVNAGHD